MEKNHEENFVKVKDLSKLKELTDDELVAAWGGRTAHKGSRHGHKMTAKVDRIAEAEREYMENYNKKMQKLNLQKKKKAKHKAEDLDAEKVQDASDRLGSLEFFLKLKPRRKRNRSLEVPDGSVEDEVMEPFKEEKEA